MWRLYFTTGDSINLLGDLKLEGTSAGETLYGLDNRSTTQMGYEGNDYIYAKNGNDTLDGGAGNDTMYGGAGDDTYLMSAGSDSDVISESASGGADTIELSGYDAADIRMSTDSGGSLIVTSKSDPSDTVTIYAATTSYSGTTNETSIGSYLEQAVFDDATWDLTGGLILEGSSSVDSLYGSANGDQISGIDGADYRYDHRR